MATMALLYNTHALPKRAMPKVIKPSNPFTNVCWVSVFLTTFSGAATNFGCIDSFLLPNSRNEEMMGDGFLWCYCCRFVLNSKRLLSTSCNKQASAVARHFSRCYSRCFLKFAESYVYSTKKQTLNNELKFHIVNIY